jgi:hypothetical protein
MLLPPDEEFYKLGGDMAKGLISATKTGKIVTPQIRVVSLSRGGFSLPI